MRNAGREPFLSIMIKSRISAASDQLTWLGVLIYIGIVPLLPSLERRPHDLARLLQMPLLALAGLGGLLAIWSGRFGAGRWAWLGVFLLLIASVSASCAAVPSMAFRELMLLVGLVAVARSLIAAIRTMGLRPTLIGVLAGAASYALMLILVSALAMSNGVGVDNWRLIVGFDNPRFFNHVQTVAMPLLAAMIASTALRPLWRVLAALTLVVNWTLLGLTLGRATLLSLTLASVLGALLMGKQGRQVAAHMLMAAVAGALLYWFMFSLLPQAQGLATVDALNAYVNPSSDHSRTYLWRIALQHVSEHPWLGIGPMHFAHAPNLKGAHPHNMYLLVAAELGVPALLLLLLATFKAMHYAGKAIRDDLVDDRPLAVGAWLACVAVLVDAGFSGNLVMPVAQLWVVLAAALLASSCWTAVPTRPATVGLRYGGVVGAAVVLCGLIWLTVTTYQDWERMAATGVSQQPQDGGSSYRPRFWLDGWF